MKEVKDMSLRDYFAGQALTMMTEYVNAGASFELVAEQCYKTAEAMMRERTKQQEKNNGKD